MCIRDRNGEIDVDADPQTELLIQLEKYNRTCCNILTTFGYNSSAFRKKAPTLKRADQAVTKANTRERQDALAAAKSAGEQFHATNGQHVYGDDFFISMERKRRHSEIERLRTEKESIEESQKREQAARSVLTQRKDKDLRLEDLKILIKWKQNGKAAVGAKPVLLKLWEKLKDKEIPAVQPWTDEDDQKIERLEQAEIKLSDTAVGRERMKMASAAVSVINELPDSKESEEIVQQIEEQIRQRSVKRAAKEQQNRVEREQQNRNQRSNEKE